MLTVQDQFQQFYCTLHSLVSWLVFNLLCPFTGESHMATDVLMGINLDIKTVAVVGNPTSDISTHKFQQPVVTAKCHSGKGSLAVLLLRLLPQ